MSDLESLSVHWSPSVGLLWWSSGTYVTEEDESGLLVEHGFLLPSDAVPLAPAPEPTYTCRNCGRAARWTDGQMKAAGDPVDEYWCQTCGEEQPLPAPDAPTAVR